MAIPASAAGRESGCATVTVSTRQLMAYAAGIGAMDACYLDDLRDGGILGHPAFCVSLEWPVVSGAEYQSAIGRAPGSPRGAIHVLQDSRFHRPIRAGEPVVTRARIAQVRQTGAGALVTSCVETLDSASGAPLVTSWTGAMFLRETVDGGPATHMEPPELRPDAGVVVPAPARLALETSPGLAHRYSECAAIWNPIHTERAAARAIGLPDIILHGTCTWALAGQALVQAAAGGDPRRLKRLAGRFKGMVFPGDRLELDYGRSSPGIWQFAVRTPRGELAITHGVAEFDE
jgi:acyl dehydratase